MGVISVGVTNLFTFHQMNPNETASVYIHEYQDNDFAAYAIVPYLASDEPPAAVQVVAQLTNGQTSRDGDDQTIGRIVTVQNQSTGPQPYISVDVLEFKESY